MGRKASTDPAMIKRVIIDWVDQHERFPEQKTRPTRQFEMLLAKWYYTFSANEVHIVDNKFFRDLAIVAYNHEISDVPSDVIKYLRHKELHNEVYWEDK